MPTSRARPGEIPTGELYRAGLPALSPRLAAAAALVRPGSTVADIGCDHGKLAVYLAKSGKAPRVIAVDVRPMPLARARALCEQTGCAGAVECRLGNGLSVLQPGEAQDIVIAGMSGETMAEILAAGPGHWQKGLRLVLVPATRAELLRGWLCRNGFAIEAERAVEDAGRAYPVIAAGYTANPGEPTPFFCETGRLNPADPVAKRLLAGRLRYLQSRLLAPLSPAEKNSLETLIGEVEAWPE